MTEINTSKILRGIVVSDKMAKTVIVKVDRYKKHPRYNRYYKVSKKYKVHDENGEFHIGDKVTIKEIKPVSKDKHFSAVKKI
ncbi:MAG: 30S ribosomal protein S17 [Candidatus Azambacteria bacterium GW2011_GWE1_42_9]|nr:MAG: 30S ribosomal protein S17 [Candidatus Azambacteria bacterium GW2011_GWF1_41_10]KKS49515.1 MAG: 30S ribosomal protein S17 [Candidatus Azambacteria bacterium GW2011_GWF2_42_22]KKS69610.1 MAG: 30S ribosomal protein S17 [Candidatus Azambacteria bacterium GW2011_GWA2_42_62]KKS74158.1 MAG: 30S ribosomal protein S17 [Candidatus Azambacteria bacterium GW2011_GWB1_42_72]KKS79522.1 MAG: 30S ribosomal protein S17 [Candidatus Azambacteria bacterium GW2011_GWE1_42_9]KKT03626.1 MAG: 30S ribosomal pr